MDGLRDKRHRFIVREARKGERKKPALDAFFVEFHLLSIQMRGAQNRTKQMIVQTAIATSGGGSLPMVVKQDKRLHHAHGADGENRESREDDVRLVVMRRWFHRGCLPSDNR